MSIFMENHIGNLIHTKLVEEGRTIVWLSKQLNCKRSKIYRIFELSDVDTGILRRIGKLLKFNFFLVLSDDFENSK